MSPAPAWILTVTLAALGLLFGTFLRLGLALFMATWFAADLLLNDG